MNCRNPIECYLSILIALLLIPQPKVFAQATSSSSSIGCQAQEYELANVAQTQRLIASDIINDADLVEQVGSNQEQVLPTNSPYKSSTTKQVVQYW